MDSQTYITEIRRGRPIQRRMPRPRASSPACKRCWHPAASHVLQQSVVMLSVLCGDCRGWPVCAWRLEQVEAA